MEIAEEEGMTGPATKLLQPIGDALHALNYWPDTEKSGLRSGTAKIAMGSPPGSLR